MARRVYMLSMCALTLIYIAAASAQAFWKAAFETSAAAVAIAITEVAHAHDVTPLVHREAGQVRHILDPVFPGLGMGRSLVFLALLELAAAIAARLLHQKACTLLRAAGAGARNIATRAANAIKRTARWLRVRRSDDRDRTRRRRAQKRQRRDSGSVHDGERSR